ncbi:hypothetical protein BURMUCGD1_0628 [Burkholderia multivorans CGD1]|nr:hypothetical protein BURMUCGD1_0628 [Burkholderia multivorans CGD1]
MRLTGHARRLLENGWIRTVSKCTPFSDTVFLAKTHTVCA